MKYLALFLLTFLAMFPTNAQWTDNGNNTTTNDNVGIGTTNPTAMLEVYKNSNSTTLVQILNPSQTSNARALLLIGEVSTGGNYGYIAHFNPNYVSSWGNYALPNSTAFIGNDNNGINIIAGHPSGKIVFGTSTIEKMRLTAEGNLGIGTDNPDAKLAVNGNIHTQEVKVDLIGWPDYVFKKQYYLSSLEEVEDHIKQKGHLKDIPSAQEVLENGIFLGDMNAKLLQKIEELTLYTIQQQKEIQSLKKENGELKSISKRLTEIEKLLGLKN